MKKLFKTVLILLPLVILAVLGALYLNLNRMVKTGVETMGPRVLQAPVELGQVSLSILSGAGTLEGLKIGNPEGFRSAHAFEMGRLDVAVDLKSLKSQEIVIQSIVIDAPIITVEGLDAKNLRALQENAAAFGGSKEEAEAPPVGAADGKKVIVDRLAITGARVNYSPAILQGKSIPIPLPPIELNDLGRDSGGLTIPELMAHILSTIDQAVVGVLKGSAALIGDATGQILGGAVTAAGVGADVVEGVAGQGIEAVGKGAEMVEGAAGQGIEAVGKGADALRVGVRKIMPFGSKDEADAAAPEAVEAP